MNKQKIKRIKTGLSLKKLGPYSGNNYFHYKELGEAHIDKHNGDKIQIQSGQIKIDGVWLHPNIPICLEGSGYSTFFTEAYENEYSFHAHKISSQLWLSAETSGYVRIHQFIGSC